jgi:hypothetical protein
VSPLRSVIADRTSRPQRAELEFGAPFTSGLRCLCLLTAVPYQPLIDSHVHFWYPDPLRYDWLSDLPILNQPLLPA